MLDAIGVRNYRTFAEEVQFEIAPITILLGANSSGKSSITRLLPLLSQSLSFRTSAPILWVTEEFDYGSFEDNVHRHNQYEPITFTFRGALNSDHVRRGYGVYGFPDLQPGNYQYELSIFGADNKTYLTALTIHIYGHSVTINFSSDDRIVSLKFDNKDATYLIKDRNLQILQGMFPTLYSIDKNQNVTVGIHIEFASELARTLRTYAHQNTSFQTVLSALGGLVLGDNTFFMHGIRDRVRNMNYLYRSLEHLGSSTISHMWLLAFLTLLPALIGAIEASFSADITAGAYLAPIRASAKRYYRRQELAIDQVDPSGENLAMYLNSLSFSDLDELNQEFMEFFDHSVRVKKGEGHISLRLEAKGQEYTDNLADVGFGFSQLLPVIAQIHAARKINRSPNRLYSSRRVSSPIVAIEQPELHLHPAYQSRLGAYFVNAATKSDGQVSRLRFLLETHSEPLVNEIASLVGQGKIPADDVRLYLFAHGEEHSSSIVLKAEILEDGSIPQWPFGFFSSGRIGRRV